MPSSSWNIWLDTGGTFTDCLGLGPGGLVRRAKVLSSSALRGSVTAQLSDSRLRLGQRWGVGDDFIRGFAFHLLESRGEAPPVRRFDAERSEVDLARPLSQPVPAGAAFEVRSPEEAPILAARMVTGVPPGARLPDLSMRLATTRGTNALLERRGARTALFITRGFGDLLEIADQQRPDLFALRIVKPEPFYERVIEVDERVAADGEVLRPLDVGGVTDVARRALSMGVTSAAIALVNSYVHPDHERILAEHLRSLGFQSVSCSAELAPLIGFLPRAETAVIDAYLGPTIERYLERVQAAVAGHRLHVMTSAGGLVRAGQYCAKDSLLSGPAGGAAGAAAAGRQSGFERIIAFDMGGTSTDVCRCDGDFEYRFEHRVGSARLLAPALAIETVAAGGGSICAYRDERLHVGPQSAGAVPGPACYGAGGPLTLTDVNLLMGRLDPQRFEIPIDRAAAGAALEDLRETMERERRQPVDGDALLAGLLELANERMAEAIRHVSVERGYDPAEDALVAFGGAGPQHACAVAERLGVRTIVLPADASLLSAVGLGHAVIERFAQRQVLRPLDEVAREVDGWIGELGRDAMREVAAEDVPADAIHVRRRIVHLRVIGQDTALPVEWGSESGLAEAFAAAYGSVYGQAPPDRAIEVESIRVIASSVPAPVALATSEAPTGHGTVERTTRALFAGRWIDVPVFERDALRPGDEIEGPAIVLERFSASVIEPGWRGRMDGARALLLTRHGASDRPARRDRPEVIELELFTNRLGSIAEEMGRMLERMALSTNVKQRLDFSCTVLDQDGRLVVNAPHMPVHLGAMGLCVRAVREVIEMEPGDVIVTNHPRYGGSHLPDLTVITPVFDDDGVLLAHVASRAHHAEIGGTRPGSMPPDATTLIEEGVIIEPQHLVRRGRSRLDEIERLLRAGSHPSRAVKDNLADLRAQLAANHRGACALLELAREAGTPAVARWMAAISDRAERLTRQALAHLADGRREALERLDDGTPIQVSIDVAGDQAVIDFAGTGRMHPGNLNATPAIVHSAVIYVLRLLIGERLPLNEGIMRAVQVRLHPGVLDPTFPDDPSKCPAVVGGNVETSQRLVDTLLKALRLCACSQGTMNNTLFGHERVSYYETVCGGSGACSAGDGADAVHTHMTNTRITDPEVLEHRCPVRLERFAIRRGSGGAGRHRGGDGAIREITFLEPLSLSLLTQHRTEGPYGLEGGEPGRPGRQRVVRCSGEVQPLASVDGCRVQPGDRLVIETPGGGGWGRP